jgi:hypothetical protein
MDDKQRIHSMGRNVDSPLESLSKKKISKLLVLSKM